MYHPFEEIHHSSNRTNPTLRTPVAGSAFEAGTDTTAGTLLWFLMAIVLHPHVLARAQAELDGVLGADGETIPGFAHIDELPYCVAVMKEVFRCVVILVLAR